MTDNTQELDEILSKAEGSCTYDCRNFCSHPLSNRKTVKQALLVWHNKQTLELLDRLEAKKLEVQSAEKHLWFILDAIEAERERLK